MRSFLALLLLAVPLLGCQNQRLVVQTRYLGLSTLASSVVGTPDPRQRCPKTGQELYISWRFPEEFYTHDDLHLEMTLRFGNREEACLSIPVERFRGGFVYTLTDDEYWDNCGVLTYKIELFSGECLLDSWYHQIWSELINFDECDNEVSLLDKGSWQM
jgi:hypothetical protein